MIVRGTVTEFNGLQISIDSCLKTDKEQLDLSDFRPTTNKDLFQLMNKFKEKILQVINPHLKALLLQIFTPELMKAFAQATAARTVHHAYGGGLLEHTLEVMDYCSKIIELQGDALNGDLLLTGAVLHDIGKLWEYDQQDIAFQRTEAGKLLGGHVILGHDFLRCQIGLLKDFPEELAMHLDHLILSHHGQREWGAVEEPRTVEAVALHYADLLSARINQASRALKSHKKNAHWANKL